MASTNMTLKEGLKLSLPVSEEKQLKLLADMDKSFPSVPSLHFETVKFRRGPGPEAKAEFCDQVLSTLKRHWINEGTEHAFLQLFSLLQNQGCAVLARMIDTNNFEKLIDSYTKAQHDSGNNTFLHSYINFADHLHLITDREINGAFLHPLLVALIAYSMGGAVRITDLRGKDTDPISINAQDNMLHIDNTPFRDEYKILLAW